MAQTDVKLPFSSVVAANGFVFVSGTIGTDATGKLVATDFSAEAHQVMKNIGDRLRTQGLVYDDLVSVTVYLKTMQHYQELNAVYSTYFDANFPTRTCIAVADLPMGASVEITCTARSK